MPAEENDQIVGQRKRLTSMKNVSTNVQQQTSNLASDFSQNKILVATEEQKNKCNLTEDNSNHKTVCNSFDNFQHGFKLILDIIRNQNYRFNHNSVFGSASEKLKTLSNNWWRTTKLCSPGVG